MARLFHRQPSARRSPRATLKVLELKSQIAKLEAEITDLEKKAFDRALPTDIQKHYATILVEKKSEQRAKKKELTLIEAKL